MVLTEQDNRSVNPSKNQGREHVAAGHDAHLSRQDLEQHWARAQTANVNRKMYLHNSSFGMSGFDGKFPLCHLEKFQRVALGIHLWSDFQAELVSTLMGKDEEERFVLCSNLLRSGKPCYKYLGKLYTPEITA